MTDPTPLDQLTGQLTGPVNRATQLGRTDGRTDGRTENQLTTEEHLAAVDARRAYDGLSSIGDLLTRTPLVDVRHPLVRTGVTDVVL